MFRISILLFLFVMNSSVMAQPSPCGNENTVDFGLVNVGQDCANGTWYVSTYYGYAAGRIVASAPMKITEKLAADGMNGELVMINGGKEIQFTLDNYDVPITGFRFSAPIGTQVVLVPDYGYGYFSIGGSLPDAYEVVNLTDPAVKHLFLYSPQSGRQLNKAEHATVRWISSAHFNNVSISIGRSPGQASWIRSPSGNQAFHITNSGSFEWDVLKINSACHDFYLKIGGYGNDGSGYFSSVGEIFYVLHPYDYGFTCPAISY